MVKGTEILWMFTLNRKILFGKRFEATGPSMVRFTRGNKRQFSENATHFSETIWMDRYYSEFVETLGATMPSYKPVRPAGKTYRPNPVLNRKNLVQKRKHLKHNFVGSLQIFRFQTQSLRAWQRGRDSVPFDKVVLASISQTHAINAFNGRARK